MAYFLHAPGPGVSFLELNDGLFDVPILLHAEFEYLETKYLPSLVIAGIVSYWPGPSS